VVKNKPVILRCRPYYKYNKTISTESQTSLGPDIDTLELKLEIYMKIEYEKAKLSDAEEIYTVMQTSARVLSRKAYSGQLKDTFDKFYVDKTPDYIRKIMENQHSYTLVAKNSDRIVGFIQLKFHHKVGNVSHLYILPGYEGKSIGTHLFDLGKERAIQLNVEKLYIESTLNALSYYEKLGFVNTGLIPDESAYNLELDLGG